MSMITKKDIPSDISIGDTVSIVRPGRIYTTYDDMVRLMNLYKWKKDGHEVYEAEGMDSHTFVVVDVRPHTTRIEKEPICGIRSNKTGHEYVIGMAGLKKVRSRMILDESLFVM